jgi:hypothetical protein
MEFKNLPIFFNMTAIENVMKASQMEDFSSFGDKMEFVKSLKFARDCAFYGIKAGCKREKIEMPYKTSEDLGDDIDSFEDLNFAVEAFTKAVGDFFQVKSLEQKAQ